MPGILEERLPSNGRRFLKDDGGALPRIAATENAIQQLTDSTTGTPATTIVDVTGAHDQAILNNNFASLTTQINNARIQANRMLQDGSTWRLGGTGAPTLVRGPRGEWLLSTGANANDQAIVDPRGDAAFPRRLDGGVSSDRQIRYAVRFGTPNDITDLLIQFGIAVYDNAAQQAALDLTTDSDILAFRYDTAVDQVIRAAERRNAAAAVQRDTVFTLAAANVYTAIIEVDDQRIPRFYLRDDSAGGDRVFVANGQDVGDWPAIDAGDDYFPYFGIETLANVAQSINIYDIEAGETII